MKKGIAVNQLIEPTIYLKGGEIHLNPEELNAELLYYYRKLISLYDQECIEVACCFKGELLDSYREVLKKERSEVFAMMDMAMKSLQ